MDSHGKRGRGCICVDLSLCIEGNVRLCMYVCVFMQ